MGCCWRDREPLFHSRGNVLLRGRSQSSPQTTLLPLIPLIGLATLRLFLSA